jgi:hypothetical protein
MAFDATQMFPHSIRGCRAIAIGNRLHDTGMFLKRMVVCRGPDWRIAPPTPCKGAAHSLQSIEKTEE